MIGRHLGHTIDIHGGGQDLIFPHHENEIAQGACANGTLYCRTWVHNSFVTVDGQKMSKSLGNVLLVRDLLAQAPGEAIRFALLSTHYRRPMDWNTQRLQSAVQTLIRFYTSLSKVSSLAAPADVAPDDQVLNSLKNELGVTEALARLHVIRAELDQAETDEIRSLSKARLLKSAGLLGILQQEPHAALAALSPPVAPLEQPLSHRQHLESLLEARNKARSARDFARADALRDELLEAGFSIEDSPEGSKLRPAARSVI